MAKPSRDRKANRVGWALCAMGALLTVGARGAEPTASLPPHVTVMPARFPIGVEQVVAAASGDLSLEAAAVSLVAPMTASTEEPLFAVTGVEPWGERRARIRIGCVRHEQCLAFYAVAEWADAASAKAALAGARTRPRGEQARAGGAGRLIRVASAAPATGQSAAQAGAGSGAGAQASPGSLAQAAPVTVETRTRSAARVAGVQARASDPPSAASMPAVAHAEIVAKSGAHATLLLEGERMHIKVPVICLESGEVGRTIRVAAADHKQTYTAEVVDATLLKGTL